MAKSNFANELSQISINQPASTQSQNTTKEAGYSNVKVYFNHHFMKIFTAKISLCC